MVNPQIEQVNIRQAGVADYAAWDVFVSDHMDATPYHLTAWKKAIEDAYQHTCFYLIAEQHSKIVGILPLVKIAPPMLSGATCSLPFCDVGGILVSDEAARQPLLEKAKEFASKHTANKLNLRQSGQAIEAEQLKSDALQGQKVRMMMPLPESSSALLSGFKSKLRSQIKKSEKNGISYSQANDAEAISAFYVVMQANMRLLGSPVHSKKWFESIIKHYGERAQIGLVSKDDVIVGAAIILMCGKTVTVPWASTLAEYNKYSPNMGLYWGLISYAADNDYGTFDFGRSSVGEGTFRFKKQWGATAIALDWQDYDQDGLVAPPTSSGNSKIKTLVAATWAKLPESITNMLGPMVRRYISL
ncbi:MAG: PEP-CTERM system-associated, FemAB-related protein [Moraxellaceae bacterium]|nr:MAG: PEP-CTERM system-associated, FemAB-related protein [Moraxellaceae bacterium]